MWRDRRTLLGITAAAALAPRLTFAQSQPLRIIVPFTAGSGTDVFARMAAEAITKTSGRTVVVENKPGAGGMLGAQEVVRSKPDGSTILFTTGGFTTNAVLMKKQPFDSINDFTPITRMSRSSGFALLVSDKSPYRTMDDYIAAAKARPGQLTFGSSGIGNTTHVMGVLFCKGVGVDLLHVPFKGTPSNDVVAGTVDSAFLSPSVAAPQIRAGQLRALGISGATRSTMVPDTRTFAELGLNVQDIPAWSGFWGPARMPAAAVDALYDTLLKASQHPALVTHVREGGGELDLMKPEPFKAYVTSEIERYRKVLPPLGIEIN